MAYKIIIVDDQPHFRESLRAYLAEELGYEVIGEAQSGLEFFELPGIPKADIVLMDIKMPDLSGIEVSKRILWKFNHLKIIAITMYKDKAYLKELIEAGIRGFVHKTVIYSEIQQAISDVINNKLHFPLDLMLD
jgi:DNA-binding NarL/FixJ family response regulator